MLANFRISDEAKEGRKKVTDLKSLEARTTKERIKDLRIRWEDRGQSFDDLIASKKRIVIKSLEEGCTMKEAMRAAKVRWIMWEAMIEDEWFLEEVEYAVDSDIRLAKSKVRLGLEKDNCEEFALKYLKAKVPNEFGWSWVTINNNIKTGEKKSVDDMLIQYYQEE